MSRVSKHSLEAAPDKAKQQPRSEIEAQAFQSLAERFERADDEVRDLERQIAASTEQLGRARVDRLALLQEIARMIGVSPKTFD